MTEASIAERIATVREKMAQESVDVMIVPSTDRFLNEYVPNDESLRVWISGFTGSMGDVVITKDRAFLAVDGRYWLQAEQETDPAIWNVVRVPFGTSVGTQVAKVIKDAVDASQLAHPVVGYEPTKTTPAELELTQRIVGNGCTFKALVSSPVENAKGTDGLSSKKVNIRALDERKFGSTVDDKIAVLAPKLDALTIDALLIQKLDEIAYLSNLRGDEIPYQATFKSVALLTKEHLFVGLNPSLIPDEIRSQRARISFVSEDEIWKQLGDSKIKRIGYDKNENTEFGRQMIERMGAVAVAVETPVASLKAKKNPAELRAMINAFARADDVVSRAARWLCTRVTDGDRVSEADFAEEVTRLFDKSGAVGLSFKVISAAGKNGAIIHYSSPNPKRAIKRGELMLLDTGAYYEEGYATDLTRTFLVDGPKAKGNKLQRYYFSIVLKSAIAGMTAVLPKNAKGYQLDAITRAPLWAEGLDFNHGTGHGVGVNVHESPPRIGPNANSVLEEGFVFSIEPGVYLPKFGGIRIENLCTIEAIKKSEFMRVVPLTFSPLDQRLIDESRLTGQEKAFLRDFKKGYKKR